MEALNANLLRPPPPPPSSSPDCGIEMQNHQAPLTIQFEVLIVPNRKVWHIFLTIRDTFFNISNKFLFENERCKFCCQFLAVCYFPVWDPGPLRANSDWGSSGTIQCTQGPPPSKQNHLSKQHKLLINIRSSDKCQFSFRLAYAWMNKLKINMNR